MGKLQLLPVAQYIFYCEAVLDLYILFKQTPDFNSKSESKSSSEVAPSRDAFSWSKTAIHDAEKARVWTDSNNEWCTITLGCLEPVWQSVTWSPSGLNKLGGCLLAVLTNNMEVSVWGPSKNPFTGEWSKLQNVTEDQIASFPAGESMSSKDVMQFQTCAIAWSSSFSEAASHLPATTNSSLLALGNRSGGVGFFYWDPSINKA
ncbi:hypothetical protein FRC12_010345, partial [Ceratobasidium sp. 428]